MARSGKTAVIRRGITRTVILTRRHAIKLPSLRRYGNGLAGLLWSVCRGILANQGEAEWWRNAQPDQRTMLCPIRHSWLGGIINIYPRCKPFEVDDETAMAMSEREYRPLPDLMPQPGDNKPDNYGWLDGQVVCLDYDLNYNGCPHDRSGASVTVQEQAHPVLCEEVISPLGAHDHEHRCVHQALECVPSRGRPEHKCHCGVSWILPRRINAEAGLSVDEQIELASKAVERAGQDQGDRFADVESFDGSVWPGAGPASVEVAYVSHDSCPACGMVEPVRLTDCADRWHRKARWCREEPPR